ncbi:unnamed protein product [Candidula unifasciata]|uniref:Methionine synthase reductase n=1 Tax=Candidula unifasciata TaxID=100452 RepID=A0A8S3YP11_9EUPU|nr:unnamed protein product [Candidula unifasciata]
MLDHKMKSNRFLLLYGSATGQAQAIAEEIAEKAPSFGLAAELHSLDDTGKKFNIEKEKCVVIITSTTGDGDPPDNAQKFLRRLRKRTLSRDYLAHLHYALLGLGDSNYSNFCRCARDLDSRLEELGAQRFYPTGLADDGVGLEIVADPWLEGLYPALQKFLGVTGTGVVALTETVQSLHLSEADSREPVNKLEHNQNTEETSQSSLPNGSINLAGASIPEDKGAFSDVASSRLLQNIPSLNESIDESVHSCASFRDSVNIASNTVVDHDVSNSTRVSDTYMVANSLATEASSKLNTPSFEDKPTADPLSSHILSENTKDLISSSCNLQSVAVVLDTTVGNTGEVTDESLGETSCVPSLSQPHSCPLPITHSQPPLSEQALTIPVLPPAYLSATFGGDPVEISTLTYQNGCKLPCAASEVFKVPILSAQILTAPDAVKKTLLLRLDIKGCGLQYSPGDSISIICPNNPGEVDFLLKRLGQTVKADITVTLSVLPDTQKRRAAVPPHIHPVSTLRHILTTCVNIREPPSKAFLRALIEHTSDEREVRRMQELCSKEGAQEYTHLIREANVSLLDFLYAFPSCNPPVETLFEHLPRLQPRPYSICSCQEINATTTDIVFNVVEIPADREKCHLYQRRGVCTGWLDDITSSLQSGKHEDLVEIPIFLRTNQHFRPPDDLAKPLIMIGPGTGVAPFIGFLHQRAFRRNLLTDGQVYGATWLFFGCRNKDKDFIFREEMHQFKANGTLSHLCVAFSRDQPATDTVFQSPRYVQDLLRSVAEEIADLLVESEAAVYVCGDAKNMAKDVSGAFEDILQRVKGLSPDEAHMFMMKKRIHKTYFEDVWV